MTQPPRRRYQTAQRGAGAIPDLAPRSEVSDTGSYVPITPSLSQLAISVRRAVSADARALSDLINRAYAIEGFFVDGARTTPDEISRLLASGTFLVLERDGDCVGELAASVYVESSATGGSFSMLAVDPLLQGMGLGTRLVRIAEAMCEAMGAQTMHIEVVNLREELARWYGSLGYRAVGTAPFAHRPVKQPCHFVAMQRTLAVARAFAA